MGIIMKKLCLLLFFAIFTAALCQSEVEFCTAVETSVINNSSSTACTVNYCNTAGVTFTCFLQPQGITFETQFSIHLCTNPPRFELTTFEDGQVLIDLRLTESTYSPAPPISANITLNVNEDTIELGSEVIHAVGGTVAKIERTILPYNSSMCPANVSGTIFDCPAINQHRARTVHELKPNDIKVIGAIGNSLTAGFLSLGMLTEYKGVSFTGGGFGTIDLVTTLPNLLREYNPDLIGFSAELSSSLEESLNVAFTAADTADMVPQTQQLIQRVQDHPQIDFENDWKLVTLLIGYNDVCVFSCDNNSSMELLNQSITNIDNALVLMRDNLPRTFVNLILIAQISVGLQYVAVSQTCAPFANFICPCAFAEGDAAELSQRTIEMFNKRLTELVDSRKYDTSNEFTVVIQPYITNSQPIRDENGTVDISYIAFDCIHLTGSGNRVYANGLWRNMFQPVGSKSIAFSDRDIPPVCPPNESPYLSTYLNSANCPPLCTHAFCSSPETRTADCTIPGVLSTCYNKCAITSCRACYYSETVRPTPDTDLTCLTVPGTKCSRQWVTQVRRADLNTYDNPRRMRTQEFFKCYQVPCPEI